MPWLDTGYGTEVYVISDGDEGSADRFGTKRACPHCGRKFATASGMNKHIERYHTKGEG